MTIKVIVNGAKGKMGSLAVEAVKRDSALELAAAADLNDNLKDIIAASKADVVVDLTRASSAFQNTKTIIEAGARPVIGTSGLLEEQIKSLATLCSEKKLGGIIAPNFSISVLLMQRFAREAVRRMPQVEILEMHHTAKEESPSGTAVRTAEIISEAAKEKLLPAASKEIIDSARGAEYKGIKIHSLRLPGYNAHQEIIFGNLGETLSIRSDVINREAYMPGIVLACKEVMKLTSLTYGLENIL